MRENNERQSQPPEDALRRFQRGVLEIADGALPDYSMTFEKSKDLVTLWRRDGGKRLRRMTQNVQDRGITTLDGLGDELPSNV